MQADANVRPGMPARAFHYIAKVFLGAGGALDVNTSLVPGPIGVAPNAVTHSVVGGIMAGQPDAYVVITYADAEGGESLQSALETHQVIADAHVLEVDSPAPDANHLAVAYDVYSGAVSGGPYYIQAENVPIGTNWTQDIATPLATSGETPSATDTSSGKVTPLKSFSYLMPGGQPQAFYKGMPKVVPQTVRADLLAKGLVS